MKKSLNELLSEYENQTTENAASEEAKAYCCSTENSCECCGYFAGLACCTMCESMC